MDNNVHFLHPYSNQHIYYDKQTNRHTYTLKGLEPNNGGQEDLDYTTKVQVHGYYYTGSISRYNHAFQSAIWIIIVGSEKVKAEGASSFWSIPHRLNNIADYRSFYARMRQRTIFYEACKL